MIEQLAMSAALVLCHNSLANAIHDAGFRGANVREAWAIAMRESGGNPSSISETGDYGVFQFNKAAHQTAAWWDSKKLLTRSYNIGVAFRMSKGGKSWKAWDLSGTGKFLGRYTPKSTGVSYQKWYKKFPAACESLTR
jgi:hypothetical protein